MTREKAVKLVYGHALGLRLLKRSRAADPLMAAASIIEEMEREPTDDYPDRPSRVVRAGDGHKVREYEFTDARGRYWAEVDKHGSHRQPR